MKILSQDKEKTVLLHNAGSVYITPVTGDGKWRITVTLPGSEEILGEYLTKEKAQEVLHMIFEYKGEQFIMP